MTTNKNIFYSYADSDIGDKTGMILQFIGLAVVGLVTVISPFAVAVLSAMIEGFVTMTIYNWVMPQTFGLPVLTYPIALCIGFLICNITDQHINIESDYPKCDGKDPIEILKNHFKYLGKVFFMHSVFRPFLYLSFAYFALRVF